MSVTSTDCTDKYNMLSNNFGFVYGSNTNGSYKKYNNGLLEMWGRTNFTATTNTVQIKTVNFPISFNNTSYYFSLSLGQNGNVATKVYEGNEGGNLIRTSSSTVCGCNKSNGNWNIYFSWTAKGSWK
ncbi:gp53-like domain-containing protein [[Clostridium] hylemonae]|uniref:gp53-like domain-containing protein n=1 Tax=[Clostridium] hylemonae TaxID=89153 RepID=UPI001A9AC8F7|nr:hypothetical protein [[Clostridium] hylemonae]